MVLDLFATFPNSGIKLISDKVWFWWFWLIAKSKRKYIFKYIFFWVFIPDKTILLSIYN